MATKRSKKHRPFLKWAGNKYAIVHEIRRILPHTPESRRLIEPFAGSAAVFLNTDYPDYLLSDINPDLITLYQTLQEEGEDFIETCRGYFRPEYNWAEAYYELRERFNTTSDAREKSALFVYLNRHGYNGLCRYNGKGGFNVPFGRYKKPYFPEEEMRRFHQRSRQATFINEDFVSLMRQARPGDVIYCDPPYVPLSSTANFTSYASSPFGLEQQQVLADLAGELSEKGITVLISNHKTDFTQKAYARARITELQVQRFISANGQNRGQAPEVLALFP